MKPLIIALDVETDKEALSIIKATKKCADIYKVGPGLVLRYGPKIFEKIRKQGRKVFLDMKFHDIPNTVLRSIKEAAKHNIFSLTVHTSAGESALKPAATISRRPLLWGVTVLTSLRSTDLNEIGFTHSAFDQVIHLAQLAKRAKLDGVVASVGEAAELRKLMGPHFQIITPGIRMPGSDLGDQKRVATPQHAREAGATYMVVGRPIIEAKDPKFLAESILKDWKKSF